MPSLLTISLLLLPLVIVGDFLIIKNPRELSMIKGLQSDQPQNTIEFDESHEDFDSWEIDSWDDSWEDSDDMDSDRVDTEVYNSGEMGDSEKEATRGRPTPLITTEKREITITTKRACKWWQYDCIDDDVIELPERVTTSTPKPEDHYVENSNPCNLGNDRGKVCGEYKVKWYYNPAEKKCRRFWFGGCGGNRNRFDSREDCQQRCMKKKTYPRMSSKVRSTTWAPTKTTVSIPTGTTEETSRLNLSHPASKENTTSSSAAASTVYELNYFLNLLFGFVFLQAVKGFIYLL